MRSELSTTHFWQRRSSWARPWKPSASQPAAPRVRGRPARGCAPAQPCRRSRRSAPSPGSRLRACGRTARRWCAAPPLRLPRSCALSQFGYLNNPNLARACARPAGAAARRRAARDGPPAPSPRATQPRQRGITSTIRFESSSPTTAVATSSADSMRGAVQMIADSGSAARSRVMSVSAPSGQTACGGDRRAGGDQVALQRRGEAQHRVLGGRVHGQPRHGRQGGQRRQVDHVHVLPAALAHRVDRGARAPDHAHQVDLGRAGAPRRRRGPRPCPCAARRRCSPTPPAGRARARREPLRGGRPGRARRAASRTRRPATRSPRLPRRRCPSRARCRSARPAGGRSRGRTRARRR